MTKGGTEIDFNVFAGAETGILKGANVNNKACISKNFHNLANLQRDFEITCLSFGETENEILLGLRNQTVKVYDVQFRSFSQSMDAQKGSGSLVGICRHAGAIVTAAQSGVVTVWSAEEKKPSFDAVQREVSLMGKKLKRKDLDEEEREKHCVKLGEGKELTRMRQNTFSKNVVGVAGKETELQLWDLNKMEEPVFRSKNVGLDMLCLRQPVWISDLGWSSASTVCVATRHGQVRLYDTRTGKRRPVTELTWDKEDVANTALAPVTDTQQVIVGTNTGTMGLWDFRAGQGYRGLVRKYGGSVGAVRDIATQPGNPYFCAVGLDRFLRVWRIGAGGKKPTHKMYLKSRLNCVVMCKHFDPDKKTEDEKQEKEEESLDDSIEIIESDNEKEEEDDVWDSMVVINSSSISNKRKQMSDKTSKRTKLK